MAKLIVLVLILAAAYWYWQGPYQAGYVTDPQQQYEDNARLMKRCMREEISIASGAGMVGADSGTGDVESLCATKLQLENVNGRWQAIE